jgi:hypothetical protein
MSQQQLSEYSPVNKATLEAVTAISNNVDDYQD